MLNFLIESQQSIEKMRDTLLTLKENEPRPHIQYHDQTHSLEQDTLEYAMKNLEVCIQAEIDNLPPPSDELMEEQYKENGRLFELCCGIREFQKIVLPVFWRNQEHPIATGIRQMVDAYWIKKDYTMNLHRRHPNEWYENIQDHPHWLDERMSPVGDYKVARRDVYNYRVRLVNTEELLRWLRTSSLTINMSGDEEDRISCLAYSNARINALGQRSAAAWRMNQSYAKHSFKHWEYQPDLNHSFRQRLEKENTNNICADFNKTFGANLKQRHAQLDWGAEQLRTKTGKLYKKRINEWAKLLSELSSHYRNWGSAHSIYISDWKLMLHFKINKCNADETLRKLVRQSEMIWSGATYEYYSWRCYDHEYQPLAYHHDGIY